MNGKESNEQITKEDVNKGWLCFEQEILYARNYNLLPSLTDLFSGPSPSNPILERLLPGLLYIKAMSIFDEGLKVKVAEVKLTCGGKLKKEDIYNRIEYLSSHKLIHNPSELHELRSRRRILAHESNWQSSWKELLETVTTIRKCLQDLRIVGPVPQYTIKGERSKIRESQDPNAACERTLRVFILDDGKMVSEISSVEKTMRDNK